MFIQNIRPVRMTYDITEQQATTLSIAAMRVRETRWQPRVILKSRRSGGWYLTGVTTGELEIEA
jgi:hypothetical protein